MDGRGRHPNSQANLETEKYKFSADCPERAQKAQKKAVEKYYENKKAEEERKPLQDAATESLNKKLANGLTTQENLHKIFEDRIVYLEQHPKEVRSSDFAYLLEAYKTFRDTSGQKPVEKIQTIDPPMIVFDFPEGEENGENKPQ